VSYICRYIISSVKWVLHNGNKSICIAPPLDIECDGAAYHLEAGRQRRQDMVRDARIRQLGWEVLRLPAWKIFDDLSDCLNQIENLIRKKTTGGS